MWHYWNLLPLNSCTKTQTYTVVELPNCLTRGTCFWGTVKGMGLLLRFSMLSTLLIKIWFYSILQNLIYPFLFYRAQTHMAFASCWDLHTRHLFSKATKPQREIYNMFFAPCAHILKPRYLNQRPRESSGEDQETLPPVQPASWRISHSGSHRNESLIHTICLIAVLLSKFIQIHLINVKPQCFCLLCHQQ